MDVQTQSPDTDDLLARLCPLWGELPGLVSLEVVFSGTSPVTLIAEPDLRVTLAHVQEDLCPEEVDLDDGCSRQRARPSVSGRGLAGLTHG